jgi:hypothetical protein
LDAAFRALLAADGWNLGGERVWIAPEIQYSVHDRRDFWGTLRLPPQMDPGQHLLDEPAPGVYRLRQELTLDAHNLASGCKDLRLERLIRRAEDPLRHLSAYADLVNGVVFAGYEQTMVLSESQRNGIVSASWNLLQVRPGGRILIPATPEVEVTSYMEPVDDSIQTVDAHCLSLHVTGDRRYKLGIKAAHLLGRIAYYRPLGDGRGSLLVRNFFCNPSSFYPEEPAGQPGRRGDAVHIYNDDGALGGFGELECQGQAIGGETGRSTSTDQVILWLYVGAPQKLSAIAHHVLGVEL